MAYLEKIVEIYKNEENYFINDATIETIKTAALYMFYHYFNADVTKLDELNNQFCFSNGEIFDIVALNYNFYEENSIDFLTVLPATLMKNHFINDFSQKYSEYLIELNKIVANIICRNEDSSNQKVISKLDEFEINEDTSFNIVVLCNYPIDVEDKLWYQKIANDYRVKNNRININIVFEDDLIEEVSDVESPKDFVNKGIFKLYNNESIAFFGEEKSFLGMISANSLKENYFLYSTKGLFASNLRYYVKSAKIDSQIISTIENEPENFCYYNNGIIITCDDYKISDDELVLYNFSIVNGGQTTNLIGRTSFSTDFGIMCKVIKNKYDALDEKVNFLSKVAEASNTQKPIKPKDLIANKKEQRMLQIQYKQAGVFLQIKRGEKIPKDIYSQPWQNASNDQVAQMLYSTIYQFPGSAKNSKSKLLENDRIYNKLFRPQYNSDFLVSLQHISVAFNNWKKKLKKIEKASSMKLGLSKNCDLYYFAITGSIYKLLSNKKLYEKIKSYKIESSSNEFDEIKFLLGQNDIGELPLLNRNLIINIGKTSLFDYFEFVMTNILIPAYEKFKYYYPNYAYSHFVKSDFYYYKFVMIQLFNCVKKNSLNFNFEDIFDLSKSSNVIIDKDGSFDEYLPGLEEELKEYRTRTYKALKIESYEVFKNNQLTLLIKFKPKNPEELRELARFSAFQCERFGEAICKIIKKYSSIDNFIKE